jgi:hypothetical protein
VEKPLLGVKRLDAVPGVSKNAQPCFFADERPGAEVFKLQGPC